MKAFPLNKKHPAFPNRSNNSPNYIIETENGKFEEPDTKQGAQWHCDVFHQKSAEKCKQNCIRKILLVQLHFENSCY